MQTIKRQRETKRLPGTWLALVAALLFAFAQPARDWPCAFKAPTLSAAQTATTGHSHGSHSHAAESPAPDVSLHHESDHPEGDHSHAPGTPENGTPEPDKCCVDSPTAPLARPAVTVSFSHPSKDHASYFGVATLPWSPHSSVDPVADIHARDGTRSKLPSHSLRSSLLGRAPPALA